MDFFEVLEERRSVRSYLPKKVEKRKLEKIISAVILAPSAGNLQAYRMVIVEDEDVKRELASASFEQEFLAEAPLVAAFVADGKRSAMKYGQRGAKLYSLQDATIAAAYFQLAAAALGLGTVWVGAFEDSRVARILGLGMGEFPVALIPLGYPAEKPERHARRSRESIASFL
ncbi:MAG: nitroreductase family protein [Candidatus Micrarchaeota archaeon]|nr:nitroreductase family protein [Candidatus Micrarchaeota archaeon]